MGSLEVLLLYVFVSLKQVKQNKMQSFFFSSERKKSFKSKEENSYK